MFYIYVFCSIFKDGQLRKINESSGEAGDEPFKFEVTKDHAKNQAHYEKLADVCIIVIVPNLALLRYFLFIANS